MGANEESQTPSVHKQDQVPKSHAHGRHPNSLAALVPTQIKPGEVRNPAGRKKAGASIIEWLNEFAKLSETEIKKLARGGKGVGAAKKAAAQIWVGALAKGRSMSGKRLAADDVDRILDRTEGRPVQASVIVIADGRTCADLLAEAQAKYPARTIQPQMIDVEISEDSSG